MVFKYITIAKELERELPGLLFSGITKLPSEAELCSRFACSRQTIRAALSYLQEQGTILKCRGSGSYISGSISRMNKVALILKSEKEYIYPSYVQSVSRVFASTSLSLSVYATGGSVFREREILNSLYADPPAGIIIEAANPALPCINSDILTRLSEQGMPIVYLNSAYDFPPDAIRIVPDNRGGAYNLAAGLLNGGCKRIITIMRSNNHQSFERYAGCISACIDTGLKPDESDTLWLSDEEYEKILNSDYSTLETFIHRSRSENCAIVCCSDELAYHTIRLMKKLGFLIPDDISVAGFDNSYYALQSRPKLTTVGPEENSLAREGAEAMLALITGRKTRSMLIPMNVAIRESTK